MHAIEMARYNPEHRCLWATLTSDANALVYSEEEPIPLPRKQRWGCNRCLLDNYVDRRTAIQHINQV